MFKRSIWIILLLLALVVLAWWRAPSNAQFSRTALIMDTLVEIRAYGDNKEQLEKGVSAAFEEMTRLEKLLSSHLPDSEISQLSASIDPIFLSSETVKLLQLGQQIARYSNGAFDMTLGAVKKLWVIGTDSPQIPDVQQLRQALVGTGPAALRINGLQVSKANPKLQVDLGGIAKGYAVDCAVKILRRAGITSAAINAGGDIRLLGDRQGQPWRIGIQHPRKPSEVLITLPLQDRAVVTSGDYERFFERDGVRYHHIFDPKSGKPARLCQSVTVVAADAVSADALATAAFVLGPVQGLKLLEDLPGVEGLLVTADGRLLKTSGLPRGK